MKIQMGKLTLLLCQTDSFLANFNLLT